jgi:hypothetical protein
MKAQFPFGGWAFFVRLRKSDRKAVQNNVLQPIVALWLGVLVQRKFARPLRQAVVACLRTKHQERSVIDLDSEKP